MDLIFHLAVLHSIVLLICSTYYATHLPGIPLPSESLMESMTDLNRIVGGQEARIEDFPHQVSMVLAKSYFCGGFIVSENWIMTAAHCVEGYNASDIDVKAGSIWRTNGTDIPIAESIMHPEYNDTRFNKDIAVLKTSKPINFTDKIQPIRLPYRNRSMLAFSRVNVSGWGKTQQDANTLPDRLMYVNIPVVHEVLCRMSYGTLITENMWCGGNYFFGQQGTCQGDSGGAAVQDGMAVGIVSFARGCAQPGSPSVFGHIAAPSMRDFVTKHTGL